MANDRIFIKCKYCEGWKMLLKFSPVSGYSQGDNEVLAWLEGHSNCHPKRHDIELGEDAGFTLHTEEGLSDEKELRWSKQNYVPTEVDDAS